MHYRFLVTFNKEEAKTSQEARDYVDDYLLNNGFVCEETRWSYGHADWYVIGGRWSGELSRHSWAKKLTERVSEIEKKEKVEVGGVFYGDEKKRGKQEKLARQFQSMWDLEAPPEYRDIPFQRETYNRGGYEDDAILLTKELYDNLLKQYEGTEESENHADLEYDEVSPDMIGKKWIVVVDYHT